MEKFEMVAKTLAGLEEVLAEELRGLGAECVEPGRRMVSFVGDKAMLYKANLCCRTALRVLKPFCKFSASTPDELYELCKEQDWGAILNPNSTFCIDTVANSEDFTHSHYVTYRVKDAIVDWFRDRYGEGTRPRVRLEDADVMINVHIRANNVTLSLDSSGESLHKRGYRVAQTEAPINEVLAAGIILLSGWRGDSPFVDPMCGSGTFLIEAALIAANINPGIYRKGFAFEQWPDFDQELFDSIYNDDSQERVPQFRIIGADISESALEAAMKNIKSAGVAKYIDIERRPIAHWEEAPQPAGVLVTNPPYGKRIKAPDMEALYKTIGNKLKNVFVGYHAWIIGYRDEYFRQIGLAPSLKYKLLNGSLECDLKEYIIFEGDKKSFLAAGGKLKEDTDDAEEGAAEKPERKRDFDRPRRDSDGDKKPFRSGDKKDFRHGDGDKKPFRSGDKKPFRPGGKKDFRPGTGKPARRDFEKPQEQQEPSENPLALRRNPSALRILQNRQPSLPPTPDQMHMRKRGWRKRGTDGDTPASEE